MRRRLVWFPFLIIALTVILSVTIVLVDNGRGELAETIDTYQKAEQNIRTEGLDPQVYRDAVNESLRPVWQIVDTGTGDEDVVKGVRDSLLELRVAFEDRDAHLLLVVALNSLIKGLQGDDTALASAQIRFEELLQDTIWLKRKR